MRFERTKEVRWPCRQNADISTACLAKISKQRVMAAIITELFRDGFVKPKASKHSTKMTRTASPSALAFLQAPQHQFPETMTILVRASDGSWVVVEETLDRPEQSSPGGIDDGFASDQSSLRAALTRDPQNKSRKEMDNGHG